MRHFLTATLLATILFTSASPALAISDATAVQHNELVSALTEVGIKVYTDADVCHKRPLSGFYHGPSRSLVLCNKGSREMTEENLDTLRHEAIHVIQDCKNGAQGDEIFQRALKPGSVQALAQQYGISLDRIKTMYESRGASQEVIQLEYEAFTGAAGLSAPTIASAVRVMCSAR